MRNGGIYRYPQAGIASSRWEKWILSLLTTLRDLSGVWLDFALVLLVAKGSLMLLSLLH